MPNANLPECPGNHKGCTCHLLGLAMFMGHPSAFPCDGTGHTMWLAAALSRESPSAMPLAPPDITGAAPTGFPALKHGQREV